jgi:hypothetical protein
MRLVPRSIATIFMGVVGFCAISITLAQTAETYKVRLTTVPIDASMMSTVAGSGSLAAVLVGGKLTVTGNFKGLRSPATKVQIHRGPKGIRGPEILELAVSKTTSGTVSGSVVLSPEQIDDLKNSRLSVQISSVGAPDGNLWGWLLR